MSETATRYRVGVIGGAGFIGRRLVERLARDGHEVTVGDISPHGGPAARFVRCDVRDVEATRVFVEGMDVVYNLAAVHRDDVRPLSRYEEVNVGGARSLCEACRKSGVQRIVFTSSVAVYGVPDGAALETGPCRPFNEYGRTKWEAEGVFRSWASEDPGRSLVIVRPTVVFGEGNRGNVYNLAAQIARGRFLMVGDGLNRKSMAYVENVADFLVHALRMGAGERLFNYADGPDLDMNQLVTLMREHMGKGKRVGPRLPYAAGKAIGKAFDLVARVSGRTLPLSAVRVMKFCASTRVDASRAAESGFRPAVGLEPALRRFLDQEFPARSGRPDSSGGHTVRA